MAHDVIVIGGGAAGEAAASLAAHMGGSVAVVERDLVGGECTYWACMPSKSLVDSAGKRALKEGYPWERASQRRDWMISREGTPYPSDASRVKRLEEAGAQLLKATARMVGPGRVEVSAGTGPPKLLESTSVVVSTGSVPFIPDVEGLSDAGFWTSREATSTRELPSSVVILGGGPVGVEMAQVYARFGVAVTIVEPGERVLPRDHPASSEALATGLEKDGVRVICQARATSAGKGGRGRRVHLSNGETVEAAEILLAVGRRPSDLRAVGVEEAGAALSPQGRAQPDDHLRIADGLFVAGDAAGGLQFTHLADYEGRVAARNALSRDGAGMAVADLSAVPRTSFTDPETSAVGLRLDEAQARGIDAFEVTADFAETARGYTLEGSFGHVTAVVDRERHLLVGAFAACPGAAELIHEAVLAIKCAIPVEVMEDTIHAFPTAARVFGNLMTDAASQLERRPG